MRIKEYITNLEKLIDELKEYDPETPCEMVVTPPHICCNSGFSDDRCYADGDDYEFTSLYVRKENVYDKKTKKRTLKKVWICGEM